MDNVGWKGKKEICLSKRTLKKDQIEQKEKDLSISFSYPISVIQHNWSKVKQPSEDEKFTGTIFMKYVRSNKFTSDMYSFSFWEIRISDCYWKTETKGPFKLLISKINWQLTATIEDQRTNNSTLNTKQYKSDNKLRVKYRTPEGSLIYCSTWCHLPCRTR